MSFAPRPVTDRIAVAPQIAPDDIAAIKAAGFVAIVNNRPDGEEAGQPAGDAVRAAAEGHGLAYSAIPVGAAGIGPDEVAAMASAIAAANGPVLAYCRSGTRSCNLWALAAASRGDDPDAIVERAADAGYDVAALAPALERLSSART